MRVLLIGSGGREHALAVSIANDPAVEQLFCAPGNPGMASLAELREVEATSPSDVTRLARDCEANLVVIGPEAPLVAGVADMLRANGIVCFGPSAAAAALEGSKSFAKDVMVAAGVPTARSRTCRNEAEVAAALDELGSPYVVKDDGLAGGKGVVVTRDRSAALDHARGNASVVVEEYLDGPEVSLFVIADGTVAVPLLPAQDYKRLDDGGIGPNTGGMGAYAPLVRAPAGLIDKVMSTVALPVLTEMERRGASFNGVLYCGLSLTEDGPKVVEFNCRFGDPETQAVLALLNTPITGLLAAAATGRLADYPPLSWRDEAAVCVVLASEGYPGPARAGRAIKGSDVAGVLHAGTRLRGDGSLVSAGGRVVNCVGTGPNLSAARAAAYQLAEGIHLQGAHFRRDIAHQPIDD